MKDTSKKDTPKRSARRPPSFGRRLEQWADENKFLSGILKTLVAALIIGIAYYLIAWVNHRREIAAQVASPDTVIGLRPGVASTPPRGGPDQSTQPAGRCTAVRT